jgi:thioredoxin-like negative regulator of GroEL
VHGLRPEYQEQVNFVILDYDIREEAALAERLGVRAHPAFAVLGADSVEVEERRFGPMDETALRALLDGVVGRLGR